MTPWAFDRLPTPQCDLASFTDHLSQAWGVGWGFPAAQYLAWSDQAGVLSALASCERIDAGGLQRATVLSEHGVDALLPILTALGVAAHASGAYALTRVGAEYFLPESPYYIGPGLFRNCTAPIPRAYVLPESTTIAVAESAPSISDPSLYFKSQMSRNLAAGVQTIRMGRFASIRCLVDIGGGAGAMAIPFAQDYPAAKVILVDLPEHIEAIARLLAPFGLASRIELRAMDALQGPWNFPGADAVLFGNFFHIFSDAQCGVLAKHCFDALPPGGTVFVHELPFDQDRSGPLVAALWNANMRVVGGRQRTLKELFAILRDAGFSALRSTPTASRFHLVEGTKE